MKILSQRDERWSRQKLGASNLTIGRYGCTTTSISMLSDYFGNFISPPDIASQTSWYTPQGLLIWSKLKFAHMEFVRRERGENRGAILAAMKDPNAAVILEVANNSHWVAALRPSLFGNDYVVADPWSGDKCGVKSRYLNVTGAAYFKRI